MKIKVVFFLGSIIACALLTTLILFVFAWGASSSTETPKIAMTSTLPPAIRSGLHIGYQSYMANLGWTDRVYDEQVAGNPGVSRPVEAIEIKLIGAPSTMGIAYQAYMANQGWTDWVQDGQVAGNPGVSRIMEAISIKLTNAPHGVRVAYQAYMANQGWTDTVYDGQVAGNPRVSRKIEAIQIKLIIP